MKFEKFVMLSQYHFLTSTPSQQCMEETKTQRKLKHQIIYNNSTVNIAYKCIRGIQASSLYHDIINWSIASSNKDRLISPCEPLISYRWPQASQQSTKTAAELLVYYDIKWFKERHEVDVNCWLHLSPNAKWEVTASWVIFYLNFELAWSMFVRKAVSQARNFR